MVQGRRWKTNRKSYVAYQMQPLSMTLTEVEGHFRCLKLFWKWQLPYLWYAYLHTNWKAHIAC